MESRSMRMLGFEMPPTQAHVCEHMVPSRWRSGVWNPQLPGGGVEGVDPPPQLTAGGAEGVDPHSSQQVVLRVWTHSSQQVVLRVWTHSSQQVGLECMESLGAQQLGPTSNLSLLLIYFHGVASPHVSAAMPPLMKTDQHFLKWRTPINLLFLKVTLC